jgi:hypothetical protein
MGKMTKSSSMADMNLSKNLQSLVEEFHEEAQLITKTKKLNVVRKSTATSNADGRKKITLKPSASVAGERMTVGHLGNSEKIDEWLSKDSAGHPAPEKKVMKIKMASG